MLQCNDLGMIDLIVEMSAFADPVTICDKNAAYLGVWRGESKGGLS